MTYTVLSVEGIYWEYINQKKDGTSTVKELQSKLIFGHTRYTSYIPGMLRYITISSRLCYVQISCFAIRVFPCV